MKNIALISPFHNFYSETFIQVHKHFLDGKIFYYSGEKFPSYLEGSGNLENTRIRRILSILKGKFNLNKFSLDREAFINSLKKNNIHLIFAEYGPTGEKMVEIATFLEIPLIVHFHGFDASNKSLLQHCNNYTNIFKKASYIVAVSKKMYSNLLKLGCPEDKLIYCPYGPRNEFLEVQCTFLKSQFISVGRFVDKKAPYYVILSFSKVLVQFPDAKLIMAGDGPLLNSCINLVRYLKIQPNVIFPGVISPQSYKDYLSESLAMVQHSITADDGDSEGTPVGIMEASIAGLPVISTFHAGIPDVIIHNVSGLLVKEHDVDGMTKNMLSLLSNVEKAKKMGEKGKKNISENFPLARHINVLNDLIERAMNRDQKT